MPHPHRYPHYSLATGRGMPPLSQPLEPALDVEAAPGPRRQAKREALHGMQYHVGCEAPRGAGLPETYVPVPQQGEQCEGEDVEACLARFIVDDSLLQGEREPSEGSDSPSRPLRPASSRLRLPDGGPPSVVSGLGRKGAMLLAVCALASALVYSFKPKLEFVAASPEGHHILQQALVALWSNTCPADSPLVTELREQPWPNRKKGRAPKVSKVIYINMKWDPVRREFMEHQLRNLSETWRKNVSLTWERFEGIGASHIEEDKVYSDWKEKGFSKAPFPKVAGDWAIAGCAASHYSSIQKIDSNSEDLVMITEDDVEIDPDLPKMWEELWRWMPDDWDIMRVGWFGDHQNCSQVVNSYVDLAAWQQRPGSACMYCGAQAYIVNPKSKQKVLDRFEKSRITHADELLSAPTPLMEDPRDVPELKAFVAWPLLAKTHFGKDGFPAFQSDRIHGRQAVDTAEASSASSTGAPEENWLPSTEAPTSTINPFAIHWPTTTDAKDAPSSPAEHAASHEQAADRTSSHVAKIRFLKKPGSDEGKRLAAELESAKKEAAAAKRKAETSEEAARKAQQDAEKAQQKAQDMLRKKAKQLALAAAQQVELKVQAAQREATAQVEKETSEAEKAAKEAGKDVAEKLKAAEEARRKAEEKAQEVERRAREALKEARESGSQAAVWKQAEHEAEAAEREASKRADQSEALRKQAEEQASKAKREREKMRGQAAVVLKALDSAEAERKKVLAALKQETAARKKAEAARAKAEEKLKESMTPKVPALPELKLPPMPSLPPVTFAPLPSLAPSLPVAALPSLPTAEPASSHASVTLPPIPASMEAPLWQAEVKVK